MVGYDGISDVVFTVLQRVMEAHASSHSSEHQLIVNKAPERTSLSDDKSTDADKIGRYMKPVTGLEQGWKLAEVREHPVFLECEKKRIPRYDLSAEALPTFSS